MVSNLRLRRGGRSLVLRALSAPHTTRHRFTPPLLVGKPAVRPTPACMAVVLGALSVGVGLVILSLGLAACASSGTTGAGQTPPPPQQCGSIHLTQGLPNSVDPNAGQVENCFWQAYQHCQAATFDATFMGVDGGAIRTFTTSPKGTTCTVQDTVQFYAVPQGKKPSHTYTCTGLAQPQEGGLLFTGCGADGDVMVPAPPA